MKSITTVDDVKELGTILCVFAHPDDETLCCGGLMCLAVKNGQRVLCVTATRGEKGIQDESRWPAAELGEIRAAELKKALDCLGVTELYFLGYEDGAMASVEVEEGAEKVAAFIAEVKPDTILTFPTDGLTGHPDHQAICRWVERAVQKTGSKAVVYQAANSQEAYDNSMRVADEKYNFFFALEKPELTLNQDCDICLCLPEDVLGRKVEAIKAMPSQYEMVLNDLGEDWARKAFERETFKLKELP